VGDFAQLGQRWCFSTRRRDGAEVNAEGEERAERAGGLGGAAWGEELEGSDVGAGILSLGFEGAEGTEGAA
jgi:hypothetical protein